MANLQISITRGSDVSYYIHYIIGSLSFFSLLFLNQAAVADPAMFQVGPGLPQIPDDQGNGAL
jgi:hypothetical protein